MHIIYNLHPICRNIQKMHIMFDAVCRRIRHHELTQQKYIIFIQIADGPMA